MCNPREPKAVKKLIAGAKQRQDDGIVVAFLKSIGMYTGPHRPAELPDRSQGGTRRKRRDS